MIISNTSPTAAEGRPVASPQTSLGKDDFLRLLTVQLQYQDPLNPMDNTEFIAQMAQFSSLEQLQNMNQSLERDLGAQSELQGAFRNNLATALVGRQVEVATEEVEWAGQDAELAYQLDATASSAHLQVLDARGQIVRDFALEAGKRYGTLTWNGKSDGGARVPEGAYRVAVQAQDATGAAVGGEVLRPVRVDGVRYDAQQARIRAAGQEYTLDQVGGVRP
ncbi:MAG: flagellar hook assembly protein FlgD [Candidatus Latescibacterota bacterium]